MLFRSADTLIGSQKVGSLNGGKTKALATNVTIPATLTPKTYYIGAIADYKDTSLESNETNNSKLGNQIVINAR